jgi:hypothetical protein
MNTKKTINYCSHVPKENRHPLSRMDLFQIRCDAAKNSQASLNPHTLRQERTCNKCRWEEFCLPLKKKCPEGKTSGSLSDNISRINHWPHSSRAWGLWEAEWLCQSRLRMLCPPAADTRPHTSVRLLPCASYSRVFFAVIQEEPPHWSKKPWSRMW